MPLVDVDDAEVEDILNSSALVTNSEFKGPCVSKEEMNVHLQAESRGKWVCASLTGPHATGTPEDCAFVCRTDRNSLNVVPRIIPVHGYKEIFFKKYPGACMPLWAKEAKDEFYSLGRHAFFLVSPGLVHAFPAPCV
jgi:hypothetical protein